MQAHNADSAAFGGERDVEEELVAEVDERGLEVAGVEAGGRDAVVCELADILGEAAAEIEEGAVRERIFKEGEDAQTSFLEGSAEG